MVAGTEPLFDHYCSWFLFCTKCHQMTHSGTNCYINHFALSLFFISWVSFLSEVNGFNAPHALPIFIVRKGRYVCNIPSMYILGILCTLSVYHSFLIANRNLFKICNIVIVRNSKYCYFKMILLTIGETLISRLKCEVMIRDGQLCELFIILINVCFIIWFVVLFYCFNLLPFFL